MIAATVLSFAAEDVAAAVPEREYRRLLRLPRARPPSAEMRERAEGARRWYARHGRPFVAARFERLRAAGTGEVLLESGLVLHSEALATRLRAGRAHAVLVTAASAGTEVADEAVRLWGDGRPDESYFLDRLAAAVTEVLLLRSSAVACRELAGRRAQLLPHLSPGCGDWDLAEQRSLMQVLVGCGSRSRAATHDGCGPVKVLASGALSPQHSVLAVFGVTREIQPAVSVAETCRSCDLEPCDYRRVPFRHPVPDLRLTP